MRKVCAAILGICSTGCLIGCGGSNSSTSLTTTPPTQITLTVTGSAPTAAGSQVDGGSWTALTITGSTATFSVPQPTSDYAVAVLCPVSPSSNPNQLEVVIEASVADFATPTIFCPPEITIPMNVNYDLTAVAGAQQAEIAIGKDVSPFTSGANAAASLPNVTAGIQDVGVVAYGASTMSAPLGVEIFRGVDVNGAALTVSPMSATDETSSATIGASGVPSGYPSFLFAQYVTAGGAVIPVNGDGAASYGLVAPSNTTSGDFYSVQATAIDIPSQHFVEALESFTDPQNLTLTLPAPFTYSGPSPAAYPSFTATYSGFTGSGKTGWIAATNWVDTSSAVIKGTLVYATSAFLGSKSMTIPDLSSLSSFPPGPPTNTNLAWVLMPFQQSAYYFAFNAITSPASESAQYSSVGGSFIVP